MIDGPMGTCFSLINQAPGIAPLASRMGALSSSLQVFVLLLIAFNVLVVCQAQDKQFTWHQQQEAESKSPINHRSSGSFFSLAPSQVVWNDKNNNNNNHSGPGEKLFNPRPKRSSSGQTTATTATTTTTANGNSQLRLVQWSKEAVQYYEGSTLVLSCSLAVSVPANGGPLKFTWFKQNKALQSSSSSTTSALFNSRQLNIETLPDYSFLRLPDLRPSDSATYSCAVSNSLGQEDRTSTQVIVNVKLKWLQSISSNNNNNNNNSTKDTQTNKHSNIGNGHEFDIIKAGQSASFECNAAGQPRPRVRWFRLVPPAGAKVGQTKLHPQQQQQQQQQHKHPARLDEAQIRSTLIQWDTLGVDSFAYQRYELINQPTSQRHQSGAGLDPTAMATSATSANEDHNSGLRWRVESGWGANQHETYSKLVLDRVEPNGSGVYECEVTSSTSLEPAEYGLFNSNNGHLNGHLNQPESIGASNHQQASTVDRLRRLFGLLVNVWVRQVAS